MSFFVPDVKCIPAGFQLPTTSIMICPKHSLDQCSINVKAEVSYAAKPARRPPTSSASSLTRRKSDKDPCGLDSNCINRALLVDTHQALGSGCASRDRVREVINNEELPRRIEQKDENNYFLTVDSELTIDAGPKSNLARFINYSCESNCETLLWKVGGSQSVGLFALKDLKALTFNYNFETFGDQKKICHCGASKCCGLIVSEGTEN
ncbi:hypothetical protein pipiens_018421 [Culex pipiens pipiens]|uniref:Uncharacterized protein n=1 Tax=Culex pipiens pipiens TaxID=38569 RepID=A0ABD1CBU5_CULPP